MDISSFNDPAAGFLVDERDEIVFVVLDRPHVLNALSHAQLERFKALLLSIADSDQIHALVVRGAGSRAFSSGRDLKEMRAMSKQDTADSRGLLNEVAVLLATLSKPTIGAINGLAYGGGALLAACFDLRVGCEHTAFSFLGVKYGRVNSTWILPSVVGGSVARDLLFTARVVQSEEAARIGLLNRVVSADRLDIEARGLALSICRNSNLAVSAAKRLLVQGQHLSVQERFEAEDRSSAEVIASSPEFPPPASPRDG